MSLKRRIKQVIAVTLLSLAIVQFIFQKKWCDRVTNLVTEQASETEQYLKSEEDWETEYDSKTDQDSTFRHPNQPSNKWVIAFTEDDVCDRLAATFDDWTILVVREEPAMSRLSRYDACNNIPLTTKLKVSEVNHLTERTKAFLYAIQNGAEIIYVYPSKSNGNAMEAYPKYAMTESSNNTIMPISDAVGIFVEVQQCNKPLNIDKSFSNTHPSIQSARYHVMDTSKGGSFHPPKVTDITLPCSTTSLPVFLSQTLMFLPRDGVLYHQNAFWALAFVESTSEHERLVLGALTQRILSLSQCYIMIDVGMVLPVLGNAMSFVSEQAIRKIHQLQCTSSENIACVQDFVEQCSKMRLLKIETSNKLLAWLRALKEFGYNTVIKNMKDSRKHSDSQDIIISNSFSSHLRPQGSSDPVNNMDLIHELYEQTCAAHNTDAGISKIDLGNPWVRWSDILLIIIFNGPVYQAIPYNEIIYRPFFPNILYCVPGVVDRAKFTEFESYNLSFVSYHGSNTGKLAAYMQQCFSLAVQLNYDVKGYLVIADDMIIVPSKLAPLNTSHVWYTKPTLIGDMLTGQQCAANHCDEMLPAEKPGWPWFKRYRNISLAALKDLSTNQLNSKLFKQCLKTLEYVNKGKNRVNGAYSDMYYIPSQYASDFAELMDFFVKNDVWFAIAIQTTRNCLIPQSEHKGLFAKLLWGDDRDAWQEFFTLEYMARSGVSHVHPFKLSYVSKREPQYLDYFCRLVPLLHTSPQMMNFKLKSKKKQKPH